MSNITEFSDKSGYRFLSNFFPRKITYRYKTWKSSEHLYQASKTSDVLQQNQICDASFKDVKKLGRQVIYRKDWEDVKYDVMLNIVQMKFDQNPDIKEKLINTNPDFIIEGNYWHDNIWGNCTCDKCKHIVGTNWLGNILMIVRNSYIIIGE